MCKWLTVSFLSCLALWSTAQPVTEKVENDRQIRQTNECCPCPDVVAGRSENMGAGDDPVNRQRNLNDCPCITRSGDSEVSPSIFMPNVIHPVSTSTRKSEARGELKPLLHPEVGLASSVLQTLREATDDEYKDALARDAARSATNAKEPEIPMSKNGSEDQNNVLNIVIKTRDSADDDILSEASNIKETKCSPENILATPSVSQDLMESVKQGLDSAVDSSNVKTNIMGINKNIDNLNIQPSKLLDNLLFNSQNNVQNSLPASKQTSILNKNILGGLKLRTIEPLNENKALKKLTEITEQLINTPLIPAIKIGLKNNDDKVRNIDLKTSPSVIQKHIESKQKNDLFKLNLNPTLRKNQEVDTSVEKPNTLKNIFKFKDVELIPPKELRSPSEVIGKSTLPQLPKLSDLFKNFNLKSEEMNNKENGQTKMASYKAINNIQIVPKNKPMTEILDTAPSPSENIPFITNFNNIDNCNIETSQNTPIMTMTSPISLTQDNLDLQTAEVEKESGNQIIEEPTFNDSESFREGCSSENEELLPDTNRSDMSQFKPIKENRDSFSDTTFIGNVDVLKKDSCNVEDENENIQLRSPESLYRVQSTEIDDRRDNKKTINMEDLQKMSDSILKASDRKEKVEIVPKDIKPLSNNNILNQNGYKDSDTDGISDLNNNDSVMDSIHHLPASRGAKESSDNICPTELFSKSSTLENTNEMNVEASEPIFSKLSLPSIKSSTDDLFDSISNSVLEPSSLIDPDPLNIFRSPTIVSLPTIGDLRGKMSNIFDQGRRDFTSEVRYDNTNSNPVTSTGILGTARSPSLPYVKPLEDIELELMKIKPVTSTLDSSKLSGGILNPYKARLAIPKSLNIKPLKIKSLEDDKESGIYIGNGRPKKPITKSQSKSSLNRGTFQIPKSTMTERQNKSNLRKNILSTGSNSRSSMPLNSFSDNIRSHAEDMVRNIQESLDSTLNENKHNLLGESLVHENLLRMASISHDDFQNKLQSLHSDLTDRLSSLHRNILDQPRYKSFRMPSLNMKSSKPKLSIPKREKIDLDIVTPKRKSDSFSIQKPFSGRRESQREEHIANNKPKLKINTKTFQPRTIELPTAANIIIPKISYPVSFNQPSKLMSKTEQIQINKESLQPETNKIKDITLGASRHNQLENAMSTFATNKQSNDSPLLLRVANKSKPFMNSDIQSSRHLNMDKQRRMPISRLNFGKDPYESPSEVRQNNVLAPDRSLKFVNQHVQLIDSSPIKGPKPPTLKYDVGPSVPGLKANSGDPKPPTLGHGLNSAPKATNDLLSNINPLNTLRSKLLRPMKTKQVNPQENLLRSSMDDLKLREGTDDSEMAQPTANDHIHIKTDGFMKENVNYKCKMLCTKE